MVAVLLLTMAVIQVTAARQESQTYDEATHLAAGYSYLLTGDFHINPEHPPLGKILPALPLLSLHPDLPAENPDWKGDQRMFGAAFLYRNRLDPDTMLFTGRLVTIGTSLALGLVLVLWVRRHFGAGPAAFTLFLYVLDANVLAHGRYVTNDVLAALWCFVSCIVWGDYLIKGRRSRMWLAGLFLGLALATKYSAVFLIPVFLLLYFLRWWQARRPNAWSLAVVGGTAVLVVALAYAPETLRVLSHPASSPPLASRIVHNNLFGELLYHTGKTFHLPAHTYLVGLEQANRHDRLGQPSYLLGQFSKTGWWYYFPVAYAVKAPAGLLILTLIGAGIGLGRFTRAGRVKRLRAVAFPWFVLLVPMFVYTAFAIHSRLNIGVRHLLPAYPFLLAAVGAAPFAALRDHRRWLAALLCMIVILQIVEAVRIYPHHLAFFNVFAGGPSRGPEYLLDSNIDWGQDLIHLRRWLDAHGNPPVCLAYFGTADSAHYGIPNAGIPPSWDTARRSSLNCIAAISVTILHDVYFQPGSYQWLRRMSPVGHAGWSIYLYDVRRH